MVSRTDEIIRYLEEQRAAVDAWPAGSLQIDWGGEAAGFRAKLTRSDRVGGKPKVDRLAATA